MGLSDPHPLLLTMPGTSPGSLLPTGPAGDNCPALPELGNRLGDPGPVRARRVTRATEHHPATPNCRPGRINPER